MIVISDVNSIHFQQKLLHLKRILQNLNLKLINETTRGQISQQNSQLIFFSIHFEVDKNGPF